MTSVVSKPEAKDITLIDNCSVIFNVPSGKNGRHLSHSKTERSFRLGNIFHSFHQTGSIVVQRQIHTQIEIDYFYPAVITLFKSRVFSRGFFRILQI